MIVTRSSFHNVIDILKEHTTLACDTETTGLRMFHGDRIFSIIIAHATEAYYFNFLQYEGLDEEFVLGPHYFAILQAALFSNPDVLWYLHNAANFDLCMLGNDRIEIEGTVHCTKAIGRVERNDHFDYDLDSSLARIGLAKSDAVEKYLIANQLNYTVEIPGKAQRDTIKPFHKVPFEIVAPYGEADGTGTFHLGDYQVKSILFKDAEQPHYKTSGRTMEAVMHNERRLQKTIYRMKKRGVLIDREYCTRAIAYETDRQEKESAKFKTETGRDYIASPKLFEQVFADEKDKWSYTKKGNPSFDSDALALFTSPAALAVQGLRDAKAKADFYHGFLYHADSNGVVHPNFNTEGTVHGRFSSSNPNFQNLTSEEDEEQVAQEFVVRRAIIPRPGFVYIMPDYDQMEYRFMLELACRLIGYESGLTKLVNSGLDVHDATVKLVHDVSKFLMKRKAAKTSNFLTVYGGGAAQLGLTLGVPLSEATQIRNSIFQAAPEIPKFTNAVMKVAKEQGFVTNWMGRRSHFQNKNFAYKGPNYIVSGGCADIVKIAMNRIDSALIGMKSAMTMTVHDELPTEVHESEIETVPRMIKEIMETVYESKYLKLTSGMEWSAKSLGDKVKGFPT